MYTLLQIQKGLKKGKKKKKQLQFFISNKLDLSRVQFPKPKIQKKKKIIIARYKRSDSSD